ncbi:hypothetical protein BXZ70DRAFT_426437 [Cristinia sonorae]|uniref:Uncharacterized protein n=1 Tax=Cristinia sonorae TaxID=1940300 RepID=A0A8K0XTS5_9AGAR|nr:hypothetical protein BXZ70DRAFT_426437 [Cristinia sonorae]
MTSSLVRASLHHSRCAHRWLSTSAPSCSSSSRSSGPSTSQQATSQTHTSQDQLLPAAKMRALVELYHNSASYITPETLEEAVDYAFVREPQQVLSSLTSNLEMTTSDLNKYEGTRKTLPKMSMSDWQSKARLEITSPVFTEATAKRETKLLEALYGGTRCKPGFEVLQEEADRIREHKKADKEREGGL